MQHIGKGVAWGDGLAAASKRESIFLKNRNGLKSASQSCEG
jgi:hypothetical protein